MGSVIPRLTALDLPHLLPHHLTDAVHNLRWPLDGEPDVCFCFKNHAIRADLHLKRPHLLGTSNAPFMLARLGAQGAASTSSTTSSRCWSCPLAEHYGLLFVRPGQTSS